MKRIHLLHIRESWCICCLIYWFHSECHELAIQTFYSIHLKQQSFFFPHLFRHWLFYWTEEMISMEKRKWLRLWKMRVIVMFESYCRQRQYIDTAWKIKHWYSMEDVYPGPNSKFIASNDSKIGIFMLPLIKFIVWNRLYLFGHIDRIKGIASQIQPTFTLQNAKPVHTHTRVHRSMAKFHGKKVHHLFSFIV